MKRNSFSKKEIENHCQSRASWHSFVRRREFEIIMDLLPEGQRFGSALELGAGNGEQSEIISKYCDHLTCTELEANNEAVGKFETRNLSNVSYALCDARDLSQFADASFDFVFSSNMLEHVEGVQQCLEECRRVLRSGGIMIHAMPSVTWKFWNTAVALRQRKAMPAIHGTSKSHWKELFDFSVFRWQREFDNAGFRIFKKVGLPFYFGHGPNPRKLLLFGNRWRWKSSVAYFCRFK